MDVRCSGVFCWIVCLQIRRAGGDCAWRKYTFSLANELQTIIARINQFESGHHGFATRDSQRTEFLKVLANDLRWRGRF
jgi:hypothetical protein